MTIEQVNAFGLADFIEKIGWVFEHSPWVAQRAWPNRPFKDVAALHRAMAAEMWSASAEEQLALLIAHPDLGARARMSEASVSEQAGAGLNQLTREEFDALHRLNSEYKQKFGFPFLYAVKGSTKQDILEALSRRLTREKAEEFRVALAQVLRIAEFRLEDLINGTVS